MPTDYEAISKNNETELGTKLKSRRTQISLYADPTHFVYELLQNADDHGATSITFRLESDRLIVEHNGTERFRACHVASISSFEDSTSENELLKTGKFGLGFKSVFALTATPRIYCGDESFEIYDLYRLRRIDRPADLDATTTRFELPFNHLEVKPEFIFTDDMKSARRAAGIIKDKYDALEDIALLFTRTLRTIRCVTDEQQLSWSRTDNEGGIITIRSPGERHTFRLRERAIEWRGKEHRPVQIAIRLDDKGEPIPSDGKLVVTFPTSISTGMGIVINGPYRTTPARETVGEGDEFNEHLVQETAELLCEMIRDERNEERLSLKVLEVLPVDSSCSDSPGLFRPIHDKIRAMLVKEDILPAAGGGYVSGRNARIARGQYMADLFSDEQLTQVLDADAPLRWLSNEVTETNTPRLYGALAGISRTIYSRYSGVEGLVPDITIRPERIFSQLSEDFLQQQSDEWVCALYCSLRDAPPGVNKSVEACPIIRLSDGSHVAVKTDGMTNAYLPAAMNSQFPTVSANVLVREEAKEYLKACDYREPDLAAEVRENILPKYERCERKIAFREHIEDLKTLTAALDDDSVLSEVKQLITSAAIVCCVNGLREKPSIRNAEGAYFPGEGLNEYFDGNPEAWFIAPMYEACSTFTDVVKPLLRKLGVRKDNPRESYESEAYSRDRHGDHERGLNGFHPHWTIDGLEFAVTNPTVERSAFIWNGLLRKSANRIRGTLQSSGRQEFPASSTREDVIVSDGGRLLREHAWIPDANGEFKTAAEIGAVENLHEQLAKDDELLAVLDGDASAHKKHAAHVLGIPAATMEYILNNMEKVEQLMQRSENHASQHNSLDSSRPGNRERRKQKLKERRGQAPTKDSVKKSRSVPSYSSSDIDRQQLFHFYRDEGDEVLFCQMCLDPMPFVRTNGEDCGECVDLLTKSWAKQAGYILKVMTSLKLVLCPVCSNIYRDYVHNDLEKQSALFEHVASGVDGDFEVCGGNVRRDQKGRSLHFNQTHLGDIRDCLDTDDETSSDDE